MGGVGGVLTVASDEVKLTAEVETRCSVLHRGAALGG